ncbi:hypothetical protein DRF57_18255 [Chryseobacterium rhizosphaerae]|uniref:Uncharacterized protein n=1 Tax=Chryseobacterium rhizosphaerae TaxID=395937 RepID=A0ABX9IH83_9FLAO|nr:hypothetical protein DRF57_18255 [Chryseobacterium rhizosphaerae]
MLGPEILILRNIRLYIPAIWFLFHPASHEELICRGFLFIRYYPENIVAFGFLLIRYCCAHHQY